MINENDFRKSFYYAVLMVCDSYDALYRESISSNNVRKALKTDYFSRVSVNDLYRFRIFLDSCLLLFNKQKFERDYFKRNFSYNAFRDAIDNDPSLCSQIEELKQALPVFWMWDKEKLHNIYIPDDPEKLPKGMWEQAKIIRNAFAHMEYNTFISDEAGIVFAYGVTNRENGVTKERGWVNELLFHYFVNAYFTNYYTGVPYKHTWISCYSHLKNIYSGKLLFHELTFKPDSEIKYDGHSEHPMRTFGDVLKSKSNERINTFIDQNRDIFIINEFPIPKEYESDFCYAFLRMNSPYQSNDVVLGSPVWGDFVKLLFDADTSISNYYVHMRCLNDYIISYKLSDKVEDNEIKDHYKTHILNSLNELDEDTQSFITFRCGFLLMELVAFLQLIEDKSLPKYEAQRLNYDGFIIDEENVRQYKEHGSCYGRIKTASENVDQSYIIERLRNSIMHGNIKFTFSREHGIIWNFTDEYYGREETIKIDNEGLKAFLSSADINDNIPRLGRPIVFEKKR